jgi:hypothetical protein
VVGECVIESGDKIDHFDFSIDGAYSQLFKACPYKRCCSDRLNAHPKSGHLIAVSCTPTAQRLLCVGVKQRQCQWSALTLVDADTVGTIGGAAGWH